MNRTDYSTVTEAIGTRVTPEALSMVYTRYSYAEKYCEGKEILEIGCGAGQGLGYLAKRGKRVVGGDCTKNLLRQAKIYYKNRFPLLCLDGQALPFKNKAFDVIILFEAIYYFETPEGFLEECRRVLRSNGVLLLCTVNREWGEFNPSPFSKRYFSAVELKALLKKHQFETEIFGGFPVSNGTGKAHFLSLIKRFALSLHLIPKTMKGKEFLKRIFFGRLVPFPSELLPGISEYQAPEPISNHSQASNFKILYSVSHLK